MTDPFLSSDASSVEFPTKTLAEAVKGDRREQLEAIRDHIAHELEANLCSTCKNSRLRTGDQASLILRLQTVLAEIDALPSEDEENRLDNIRSLGGLSIVRSADPKAVPSPSPTEQRRTGSRRAGGGRGPAS